MTTFGWILHSSLDLFYSQQTISITTVSKAINTIRSFENTQLVINSSGKNYIHNTDEKFAVLERSFRANKIQSKVNVQVAKSKIVKEMIEKSEVAREMKVYREGIKILSAQKTIIKTNEVIKPVEEIEKDNFNFKASVEVIKESYAINYRPFKNYKFVAFQMTQEQKELQDEVKLAMAAPLKTQPKLPEVSEEELKLDESDELILKNLDEEMASEPKVENRTDTVNIKKTLAKDDLSLEEDDLNIYEYSNEASNTTVKIEKVSPLIQNTAISNSVSQVIGREMKNNTAGPYKFEKLPLPSMPEVGTTLAVNENKVQVSADYSSFKAPNNKRFSEVNTQLNTQLKVRAMSLNLMGKKQGLLKEFDYQSVYDVNEVKSSNTLGEIDLSFILARSSMKSLSLRSDDYLKTNINVELSIEDENEVLVPMLEASSVEAYLINKNIETQGGFLLIRIDNSVENIGLDKSFAGFVNFDDKLKITQDETRVQYVMYLGVAPGNVLVSMKTKDGQSSYITHVIENELTYDYLSMNKLSFQKIELSVEELMSKKALPLNIPGEEISSFSNNKKSQKLNMNTYEFSSELTKADVQNYFEIKNKEMNVFFGVKPNQKVMIPSRSYQDEIYNLFHVKEPNEVCIVQINLDSKRKLDNIRYLAQTVDGQDNLSLMALDKDGTIGEDITDTTSKLFFKGEHQGVLNIELNYVDNSQESFQTFCSPSIYLIEQR